MFEIAAIIINYNSSRLTQECIESILKKTATTVNFQIIVVDNCSEKDDFLKLKQFCDKVTFSNLQLVRSKINTGFGAGNMLGVHYASAKHIAFINNDTVFLNDCLTILMNALQNDSSIGMVGGQSYKEDGTRMQAFDHFASITKELLGRDFLEKANPKRYPKRKAEYKTPTKVNYVQGSFMMVRNEDFNFVGGFDTNIFLYYEETDLCKRLEKTNKSCYLIPDAHYIHYHGASTPSSIYIKIELKISLLYIIRKHSGYLGYKFLLSYLQIQYFFKSFFKPKYWSLFKVLLVGAPLSKSLKIKQKLQNIN
ncbi:glycosyltransferase family 2 protein [Flavobacterium rhamnosiphilum]|uniref:Glycosyltransferase family 2 protein n=1 Tax=Flavobacterium rhamnosiphilum TaxID=2541724 RepID=A0A4R5F8C7_9FLAO|nr:glycosyltransferase family 2 protein [Flavobacterium rhamnosiphilum]TDE43936.1 glycosyltransferase family 2 protein [Flavobacterium rhamnosiphilum]